MKKIKSIFALIAVVCLIASTFTNCIAEETEFDGAAYAQKIHDRFTWATENCGYETDKYYNYYNDEVKEEEKSIDHEDGTTTSYIQRSMEIYYCPNEDTMKYTKSVTVNFNLYDKGLDIAFISDEDAKIIREILTITEMAVLYAPLEDAKEYTQQIIDSFDGSTRSDIISNNSYIMYIQNYVMDSYQIVVLDKSADMFKIDDNDKSSYREMDYAALTAPLNQGENASFIGRVINIEAGNWLDGDKVTVELSDGNSYTFKHTLMTDPYTFDVDKTYKFYGRISDYESNAGEFTFYDCDEMSD